MHETMERQVMIIFLAYEVLIILCTDGNIMIQGMVKKQTTTETNTINPSACVHEDKAGTMTLIGNLSLWG